MVVSYNETMDTKTAFTIIKLYEYVYITNHFSFELYIQALHTS